MSCSNSTYAGWLCGPGPYLNGSEGSVWVSPLRALSCSKWISLAERWSVSVTSCGGELGTFCTTWGKALPPLNSKPWWLSAPSLLPSNWGWKTQHPGGFSLECPEQVTHVFLSLVLNRSLCCSTPAYYYCLPHVCLFHRQWTSQVKKACAFPCVWSTILTPALGPPVSGAI